MTANYENIVCPNCSAGYMEPIGERNVKFSFGKAALGAAMAGPMGFAAGALGERKITYRCNSCGYTLEK